MKNLRPLQQAVERLQPEELRVFRHWFAQFDYEAWNQELECDANSGRLDEFTAAAVAEFHTGRLRRL